MVSPNLLGVVSNFSRGRSLIKPVLGCARNSAYAARSSADGDRNCVSSLASSARFVSISLSTSARDGVWPKAMTEETVTKIEAAKILFICGFSFGRNAFGIAGRELRKENQTPDFIGDIAAWRNSPNLGRVVPGSDGSL